MGQLKTDRCPVCNGENGQKWTCAQCAPVLAAHRELIRNLQAWGSYFEDQTVSDVLTSADGQEYSIWDIRQFYEARHRLPTRMREAIEMCLYRNMLERDAAVEMGLSPRNPVSIYANVGIARLLSWAFQDDLGSYNPFARDAVSA